MNTIIRILSLIIILGSSAMASAQSRIDRVMEELEKCHDVETTYTERRTPKKHKLYRITLILNFSDPTYYARISKAFEEERSNTISAVKNKYTHTYRFSDKNGESTYTITISGKTYTVVKSWRSSSDKDNDDDSYRDADIINENYGGSATSSSTAYHIGNGVTINCSTVSGNSGMSAAEINRLLAREQRELEAAQRELAAAQRELANEQRKLADKQRKEAARQRKNAEKQLKDAQRQQKEAMRQLKESMDELNSNNQNQQYYIVSNY